MTVWRRLPNRRGGSGSSAGRSRPLRSSAIAPGREIRWSSCTDSGAPGGCGRRCCRRLSPRATCSPSTSRASGARRRSPPPATDRGGARRRRRARTRSGGPPDRGPGRKLPRRRGSPSSSPGADAPARSSRSHPRAWLDRRASQGTELGLLGVRDGDTARALLGGPDERSRYTPAARAGAQPPVAGPARGRARRCSRWPARPASSRRSSGRSEVARPKGSTRSAAPC